MRNIRRHIFSKTNVKHNTIIGNLGDKITTAAQLSGVLSIATNRITNYEIIGNDIYCKIRGVYNIPNQAFGIRQLNQGEPIYPELTFYDDEAGLIEIIGDGSFANLPNFTYLNAINVKHIDRHGIRQNLMKDAYFPNLLTFNNSAAFRSILETFVAPKCTYVGSVSLCGTGTNYSLIDLRSANQGTSDNFFVDSSGNRQANFQAGAIVKIHQDWNNHPSYIFAKSKGATIEVYDNNGIYIGNL